MRTVVAAVLLCILVVGLSYSRSQERSAPAFITAPVERGRIATEVKATGTVEAVLAVDVSSQLSGRAADVLVNFNDVVKTGEVLARLDPETYAARVSEARAALNVAKANALQQQAALQRAHVALKNARTARTVEQAQFRVLQAKQEELEREYQRKFRLLQTAAVSDRDMTQARAARDVGAASLRVSEEQINSKAEAIDMAQAEEAMAQANVINARAVVEQKQALLAQADVDQQRTEIRAPIDGTIIKRDINPGQTVAVTFEAKTLFKIANDLSEMEVHGKIDEADVGQLEPGQPVQFTVDAYPDRTFRGRVLQIRKFPEVVQNVVTYTTIISAPNPDLLLLPGMTAQLRIVVHDAGEILKIPGQALRFRPKGGEPTASRDGTRQGAAAASAARVWVVGRDGRPSPIAVKLGVADDTGTALLDGPLTEGQPLIVGIASPKDRGWLFGIRLGF
jgi:HlyD family secretion protein